MSDSTPRAQEQHTRASKDARQTAPASTTEGKGKYEWEDEKLVKWEPIIVDTLQTKIFTLKNTQSDYTHFVRFGPKKGESGGNGLTDKRSTDKGSTDKMSGIIPTALTSAAKFRPAGYDKLPDGIKTWLADVEEIERHSYPSFSIGDLSLSISSG